MPEPVALMSLPAVTLIKLFAVFALLNAICSTPPRLELTLPFGVLMVMLPSAASEPKTVVAKMPLNGMSVGIAVNWPVVGSSCNA